MQSISPKLLEKLRFNENGLIPAIAQDWLDGTILMMAWMNSESIIKSIDTGEVHYWSRSREEIWHKGATSGNIQILKGIRYDCDADVILLCIEQKGSGACHKGERSCFFKQAEGFSSEEESSKQPPSDACSELFNVIEGRKQKPQEGSYTNSLLQGGDISIIKKILIILLLP